MEARSLYLVRLFSIIAPVLLYLGPLLCKLPAAAATRACENEEPAGHGAAADGDCIVLISNRVPIPKNGIMPAGGLTSGVQDSMKEKCVKWFGWNADVVKDGETQDATNHSVPGMNQLTLFAFPFTEAQKRGFYQQFSNQLLWPLFHSMVDKIELYPADDRYTQASATYNAVNRLFASTVKRNIPVAKTIWVHDYHHIPLGCKLREVYTSVPMKIGFFLHIPFPSVDAWTFVERELHGLLAGVMENFQCYDLVGLQTKRDQDKFLAALSPMGGPAADALRQKVKVFPIGINAADFRAKARANEDAAATWLGLRGIGRPDFFGVERADYTKGVPRKLMAYEGLLRLRIGEFDKTPLPVYLQLSPTTRGGITVYDLEQAHEVAAAANVSHGFGMQHTLKFIQEEVPRETLAGIMRQARVMVVTPVEDGMNLCAKEFIAAQDDANPGVLVLSQQAGAAEKLRAAVTVDAYNGQSIQDGLLEALAMGKDERVLRHTQLKTQVFEEDTAASWATRFLEALGEDSADSPRAGAAARHRPGL